MLFCRIVLTAALFLTVTPALSQWPEKVTESYGDQLVLGMVQENSLGFNPYQIHGTNEKQILQFIFGPGLIQSPGKMDSPPPMIERFVRDAREDDRHWRIVLRRNIIFQDGSDLRNQDVKFTFEVLRRYGGYILNRRLDFHQIQHISLNGDLEIAFELQKPDLSFPDKFRDIAILSSEYYQGLLSKGYEIFEQLRPMGLGPFAVQSISNQVINLRFHRHYYSGRPFLDGLQVRLFDSEQAMVDALVNGQLDYVELQDRRLAEQLHQLMGKKILVFTIPRPEKKVYFILFNLQHFPFRQRQVREALFLAINRKAFLDRFRVEEGSLANTLFSEELPVYYGPLFREGYDPARALAILKDQGWTLNPQNGVLENAGKPFSFQLYFSQYSTLEESIARLIKIYLGELNINVQPVPIAPKEKWALVQNSDYQAMLMSYSYDPAYLLEAAEQFYFDVLKGDLSHPNYRNPRLDQLFSAVYQRPSLKQELFRRFQFYLKRDRPAIFLFFDPRVIVVINSRFHNVRSVYRQGDRYFYRLNPIENWFVPKPLQKYTF